MDRSGRVVILLTVIFCRTVLTKIVPSNEIAEATVKHLASIESGVPRVVFYKLYGGDSLDETIRSPQLEHVSRLVISCGFDTGIIGHLPLEPTLIVMQGEVIWCINQIGKSLQAFKSSTKEYDLHVATRREKLILFPMVVLMFFITNAYSTILISLLIDRPANYPILTLENLVESGVRIKTNQRTYRYLRKHHILGDLLVVSNESVFNMDLEHAHVVVRETAEHVLPMYYDSTNRMFRYNIMDQTLNMAIYMFRLSRRSDLLEVLQFVCHALIESGIRDVFKSKVDHFARQLPTDENDEELHFADLTLPWMALLCGLSGAGAALVVELVLSWALAHWRPIVKRLKFCLRSPQAKTAGVNHLQPGCGQSTEEVGSDLSF
ncbi:hypothetical protein pipiens_004893 [Culex pipiens pipiens]|uniref:Ionotropic receptor n=1 Tax=Culex pipiens pipiens TaxID=38569 RepID=A0ABD1CEB4_CULPP